MVGFICFLAHELISPIRCFFFFFGGLNVGFFFLFFFFFFFSQTLLFYFIFFSSWGRLCPMLLFFSFFSFAFFCVFLFLFLFLCRHDFFSRCDFYFLINLDDCIFFLSFFFNWASFFNKDI